MQQCLCLSFLSDIPPMVAQPCTDKVKDLEKGGNVLGSSLGQRPEFRHTHSVGPASPICLQIWTGNTRERFQGSRGCSWQNCCATLQALLVGSASALLPGFPILAMPSPDACQQQSLSSPSLLPTPVSSALLRFQAPLHSKVVTNFQL